MDNKIISQVQEFIINKRLALGLSQSEFSELIFKSKKKQNY